MLADAGLLIGASLAVKMQDPAYRKGVGPARDRVLMSHSCLKISLRFQSAHADLSSIETIAYQSAAGITSCFADDSLRTSFFVPPASLIARILAIAMSESPTHPSREDVGLWRLHVIVL